VQKAKALFMNSFCCVIKPFVYATGFSQWLMTNFSERRIHSAFENFAWMVVLLHDREFSAAREHCPPEKTIRHSLLAIRHRFRLGRSLAFPICPPTEVGVYENEAC